MLAASAAVPPARRVRCADIKPKLPCCSMLTIAAVTGSFPARPDDSGCKPVCSLQLTVMCMLQHV